MACYICLKEGVTTPDHGECQKCGQHACGRPPLRRDKEFHGDECAVSACGLFFCERHMHGPHPAHGDDVSSAFPAAALAIGVAVIAATAPLEGTPDPEHALAANPEAVSALNRYMTCVSPGATALYEEHTSLPAGTFEIVGGAALRDGTRERLVVFLPSFFKREVLTTVSRMALRTAWVAGTMLGAHVWPATSARFSAWTGSLGTPAPQRHRRPPMVEQKWLAQAIDTLPARDWLYADLSELPEEKDARAVARLLARRYDEGTTMQAAVAGA